MDIALFYGLTILSIVIVLGAQIYVSSSYKKYSKIKNEKGITGKEAARYILDKNGLENIKVVETGGHLSDHYDPSKKVIRLSSSVYNDDSVGSIAVAAHECGHAIQDKQGYMFMKIRSALVPITTFSSYAGYLAIIIGIIFASLKLIWIGIILEVIILLFQLVTLPVEIDASKRALKEIKAGDLLTTKEHKGAKTMLTAAALTYVASVAAAILELVRLVLMFGRND